MEDTKKEIGAEVRVLRRYNTGNYTHVELELKLSGSYDTLVNNPEMASGLMASATNMGSTMDKVLAEVLANYNKIFVPKE